MPELRQPEEVQNVEANVAGKYEYPGKSAGEPANVDNLGKPEEITDLGHLDGGYVPPTNDLALVSFLAGIGGWILAAFGVCPLLQGFNLCLAPLAFVTWTIALFSGFIARSQIMESEEGGDDLAVWGMATGGAGLVLGTLLLLILVVLVFVLGANVFRF